MLLAVVEEAVFAEGIVDNDIAGAHGVLLAVEIHNAAALEHDVELLVIPVLVHSDGGIGRQDGVVEKADGRIAIKPGSGVNDKNIAQLWRKTRAQAFHLSAKRTVKSGMAFRREGVPMGLPMMSEFERYMTDGMQVRACRVALEKAWRDCG